MPNDEKWAKLPATMGKRYTRVHRLLRLMRIIQASPSRNADDLARELETSTRSIYRDLDTLRVSGVPCELDPVTGGYRVPREFFMPPVELTFDEALSLLVLMEHLPKGSSIPFINQAGRVVEKVLCQLPPAIHEQLVSLDGRLRVDLARGMADDSPGEIYNAVRLAIANRRALQCRYEPNRKQDQPESFIFKPYALWYCQRAWYVVGGRQNQKGARFLKLNRFILAEPTNIPCTVPDDFSLTQHLGNAWRMIRGDRRHEIAIRFRQPFAETVSETRWHPTQTETWSDDQQSVTLRFSIDGLDEIVWWILGYGPGAEVLEPPELRDLVHQKLTESLAIYAPQTKPPKTRSRKTKPSRTSR